MKFIKLIIVAFLFTGFWSCSDYLDSMPITKKVTGLYYSTPANAYEALVGCYDGLQYTYSYGKGVPFVNAVMSDLCFAGTGVPDADNFRMFDEFDRTVEPSMLDEFEENWIHSYRMINRCNTLIQYIPEIDWTDNEEMETLIEGEARFLRAYVYLDMVRMWENIPLLTEPSTENIPQADPDDVYKVIAEDLLFAIDNCRDTKYGDIAATDHGHATKWAAKALLARAFMFYTGYYDKTDLVGLVTKAEALQHLEDVIAESGHGLLDSYYDLWPAAARYKAVNDGNSLTQNTYAGETNKEVVFAIKYTYDSDYDGNLNGNHWMAMFGIREQGIGEFGYGAGWGGGTVVPEFYNSWDDTDDRKDASVIAIVEEGVDYTESKTVKEYTGYFTKKYIPLCDSTGKHLTDDESLGTANFFVGQYQDYFAIRYADVLLMAAELGSPNALQYVNEVHTRSCDDELTTVDKDIIYNERKLEFAFEGIRFWDLLRYDNTLQYASAAVTYSGTVLTDNVEAQKVIDGQKLIDTRGLYQIPKNQITLSNYVLKQNTGWE